MEGSNGEIISRYLNELVIAADNKTMSELISLIRHKIDIRLRNKEHPCTEVDLGESIGYYGPISIAKEHDCGR